MGSGSYVVRRGRMFSFRCRLPADLAARAERAEYVRALGTERAMVARYLAAGIGLRLSGLWARLRMMELGSDVEAALRAWFVQEIDRAWRAYDGGDHARALIPAEASDEQARAIRRDTLAGDAEQGLERLHEAMEARDYATAAPAARLILSSMVEAPFDEGDQRFTLLKRRVMEAKAEIEDARYRWATTDDAYRPSLAPGATPVATPAVGDAKVPTLSELMEDYLHHRATERKTSGKMIGQLRGHLVTVLDALGHETKATDVTGAMAGTVFTAFRSLPARYKKVPALSGLGLLKAAEVARATGLAPMHPKTVNNVMTTMRGLFNEAIDQGVITVNPFAGKHRKVEKTAGSERGFTDAELAALLASPVFVGCERNGRPFRPGAHLLNDSRFWLPLVTMFTGARIAELCQLCRADVVEVNGVLALSIAREGEKRLKNAQSVRILPVHDELIRLGFLEYVQTRPLKGAVGSLFGIPAPPNGNWGGKAGNWFRDKLLLSVFGKERRHGLGFHSFRHRVETDMRAAGVREDVSKRLTGHKAADVAAGYGRYELPTAKEAVMKIRLLAELANIPPRLGLELRETT